MEKQYYVAHKATYTVRKHQYDEYGCNFVHSDSPVITKGMLEDVMNQLTERIKKSIPDAQNIYIVILSVVPLEEKKREIETKEDIINTVKQKVYNILEKEYEKMKEREQTPEKCDETDLIEYKRNILFNMTRMLTRIKNEVRKI